MNSGFSQQCPASGQVAVTGWLCIYEKMRYQSSVSTVFNHAVPGKEPRTTGSRSARPVSRTGV